MRLVGLLALVEGVCTFSTDAPAVRNEAVLSCVVSDCSDVCNVGQDPDVLYNTFTQLCEVLLQFVDRTQRVDMTGHIIYLFHVTQLQQQIDNMRFRNKPQEVLSMIETVHYVGGYVAVTEVVFQLCQRATIRDTPGCIQHIE